MKTISNIGSMFSVSFFCGLGLSLGVLTGISIDNILTNALKIAFLSFG